MIPLKVSELWVLCMETQSLLQGKLASPYSARVVILHCQLEWAVCWFTPAESFICQNTHLIMPRSPTDFLKPDVKQSKIVTLAITEISESHWHKTLYSQKRSRAGQIFSRSLACAVLNWVVSWIWHWVVSWIWHYLQMLFAIFYFPNRTALCQKIYWRSNQRLYEEWNVESD